MSQPLHNEKQLLQLLANGDELAFRQIFDQYRPRVHSFAFSLTHTDIQAEEITQEVFIRVWEKRSQLVNMEYFETWMKTIARNAAYSFFRRSSIEKRVLNEHNSPEQSNIPQQEMLEGKELEEKIRRVLNGLTAQQKIIFSMMREESKTYAEIAQALGISVHTVKYHISSIYREIRSQLGPAFLVLFFMKNILE